MLNEYDYIVVGSGAGGGPVAARLAAAGHTVLLIEAGARTSGNVYDVPAYHPWASQAADTRWDFLVDHYSDDKQKIRDSKFQHSAVRSGVLYPRAASIGGCTVHHALISIYPHDEDFDRIAKMTGDSSWNSVEMRKLYRSFVNDDPAGKKPPGKNRDLIKRWLRLEIPDPKLIANDAQLLSIVVAASFQFVKSLSKIAEPRKKRLAKVLPSLISLLSDKAQQKKEASTSDSKLVDLALSLLNPNNEAGVAKGRQGAFFIPLSTRDARRVGTREFIDSVQKKHPDKLFIKSSAFATRLILDPIENNDRQRLVTKGVQYAVGDHLYSAGAHFDPWHIRQAKHERAFARKEVILSMGTFNTPQILMLSGIGPAADLKQNGIKPLLDLPGVGKNLHDRYEVTVINRLKSSFSLWEKAYLDPSKSEEDQWFKKWKEKPKKGFYTTAGGTMAFVKKSSPDLKEPDLFIFGMPGYFRGYYPGYHKDILTDGSGKRSTDIFTWAILKKSPSTSTRGSVILADKSPFVQPHIKFNYFPDGANDQDAIALANGVRFVRSLASGSPTARDMIYSELQPGTDKVSNSQLSQWIRDEAWGHHACGTCRIGPSDEKEQRDGRTPSVVDSKLRVHGVKGLRVVDASVFPDIPGFFIALPIYMIAEKAAWEILNEGKTHR